MKLFTLHRGTVLRKTSKDSEEVGIILGLSSRAEGVVIVGGWISDPPHAGCADLPFDLFRRGIWQIATEEDAATARALFKEHAHAYGPESSAWVAAEGLGPALTPPIAKHL